LLRAEVSLGEKGRLRRRRRRRRRRLLPFLLPFLSLSLPGRDERGQKTSSPSFNSLSLSLWPSLFRSALASLSLPLSLFFLDDGRKTREREKEEREEQREIHQELLEEKKKKTQAQNLRRVREKREGESERGAHYRTVTRASQRRQQCHGRA